MNKINKMKKRFIFLVLVIFFLIVPNIVTSAKVDAGITEKFNDEQEVSVIVMLKDGPVSSPKGLSVLGKPDKTILEQKKAMIKKQQDNVLSRLKLKSDNAKGLFSTSSSNIEFSLRHKYSTVNGFSGRVTEQGLEKLVNDPNVKNVYLDKAVHAFLDQSIPQINADDVWSIQLNSTNITGLSETICIIDTGIDYTHPALGGCSITTFSLSGTNESGSPILESEHNYTNNFDNTWNITKPGYTNIALHFKNISLEYQGQVSGYDTADRITIYDSDGLEIASYHGIDGIIENLWTPHSGGDTIYVRLETDGNVTDYGFYINYVLNGTTNTTYNWSSCSKVIGGWDFVNNEYNPMDDHGHGTHCAGIAASENETYKGVAPDAKLVAIKVLDSDGNGWDSDVIAGIDWCVNRTDLNISVISMSLGMSGTAYNNTYCDGDYSDFAYAINSAVGEGILVAIASGNCEGVGCTAGISVPSCIKNATPVGAVTSLDIIDLQRGNILDLLAPGASNIYSTIPGSWGFKSGTSMAAPHVAGAAALLKQFVRLYNGTDITPQEIEDVLNATGKEIDDMANFGRNYSRIDVYAAIISMDDIFPYYSSASDNVSGNVSRKSLVAVSTYWEDSVELDTAMLYHNATGSYVLNSTCLLSGNAGWCNLTINTIGMGSKTVCWKQYANDSTGNLNNTMATHCFNVSLNNTAPAQPNLTSPKNNSYINSINMIWNASTDVDNDAVYYYVLVNGTQACYTNNTNCSYSPADGYYEWYVIPYDGIVNGTTSTLRYYTYDTILPTITVSSSAGTSTTASSITISGITNGTGTNIVNVTVNGVNATLNISTGEYSQSVSLSVGSNPITVITYDQAGNNITNTSLIVTRTSTSTGGGGRFSVTYEQESLGMLAAGSEKTVIFSKSETLAVTEITVTVKNKVTNAKIKVDVGSLPSGASVPSSAGGSVYKYIEITKKGITDDDISKGIIKFKVKRSWLTDKSYGEDTITLYRYYNNKWNKLTTTRNSQDTIYYYYNAESPGFSTFAITAEKATTKTAETEVTIKKVLEEEEPEAEENLTTEEPEKEEPPVEAPPKEEKEAKSNTALIITLIVIIIVLIIVSYFVQKKKQKKKKEYKKEKKKKHKRKG